MDKRGILTICGMAAVGVVIAGAIAGLAWYFKPPTVNVSKLLNQPNPIEMMAPDTHEWVEEHFPAADNSGKDEKTRVVFRRTGNVGWRIFRPDHTLAEFVVNSKAGEELVHLFYSARGVMIVGGFEKRDNGTLRRVAKLEGDVVTLTTFWQDGKTPFEVERRKVDDMQHTAWFFHPNGARWSYQEKSVYGDDATVERDFDDEDRLVRDYAVSLSEYNGVVNNYRGDGSMHFVQHFAPYKTSVCYGPEGCGEVQRRGLKSVDEFDSQNRVVRRINMVEDGDAVESVDIIDPSTGMVVSHLPFVKDKAAPIALDAELTNTKIERLNAYKAWKAAEEKVSDIVPQAENL